MTTFTIDNDYISVALDNAETYTPATGEVQKLNITALLNVAITIDGIKIKQNRSGNGEPNSETIPVILDDTQTVEVTNGSGIHISGFVIN